MPNLETYLQLIDCESLEFLAHPKIYEDCDMDKSEVKRLAAQTTLDMYPGWVHDGRGLDNLMAFANAVEASACAEKQKEIDALSAQVELLKKRRAERDNKVQMHVDLNEAYSVLLGLTHKLNLKAFNADLRDGRSFLSRMVDISDYPPT